MGVKFTQLIITHVLLIQITYIHRFPALNVIWTRTVTSALGKLLNCLWCFLKIYTDKNYTQPPVSTVAPNVNSGYIIIPLLYILQKMCFNCFVFCYVLCPQRLHLFRIVRDASGLQKLFHPAIPDGRTWSKFGEHGEHGKDGKHQPDDLKGNRRLLKEKSKPTFVDV